MATKFDIAFPGVLAVILTLANAVKPAVVDDTAYLLTARHIADRPTDPYGFDLFWYDRPQPAWKILLPPVLPYWFALGIRLFGNDLFALKLWLFPIALLLSYSLAYLLRRFARGWDRPMLASTVLGPAMLPTFNAMLDLPSLAFGTAALACFVRGCTDRMRIGWVLSAGALAALAAQTKYTGLTIPVALGVYGVMHRRVAAALLAGATATGLFVAWECVIADRYGESHFAYHLRRQTDNATSQAGADPNAAAKIEAALKEKARLFQPMLGQLGWLGVGVGLTAASAAGWPRRAVTGFAMAAAGGFLAVCLTPREWAEIVPRKLDLPTAAFVSLGAMTGLATLAATANLLARRNASFLLRRVADSWFLAGWLALELAAYFAMTPFPAGRRVIGLVVVGGLIAARLASRVGRVGANRQVPPWVPAFGIVAGLALAALDCWDALPEKVLAEQAAAVADPAAGGTVWFVGHWGYQYYCDLAGMRPAVPARPGRTDIRLTPFRKGDRLVIPVLPDVKGFYRPYHGEADFPLDLTALELLANFDWDDRLPAQTIPHLYGGTVPVSERGHPRLRVAVYRVIRDWTPSRPARQ